ncbi:MAG: hypothetical protein HRU03_02710 [Nanoarchaeales archaeon]|nr:hypothetical protein [Nanoarchaeales archaeon]
MIQTKLKIKKINISKNIILLVFKNQLEITSTFLRFQEHYESPKFRNKIFTLDEYKLWYTSIKGKFSYYTDWNGFNIPSHILTPFYNKQFKDLTSAENQILELLKNKKEEFYIIGIHKNSRNLKQVLKHETAHGLFYTNKEYKDKIQDKLKQYKLDKLKKSLLNSGGYHSEVIEDETHAYSLDYQVGYLTKIPIFLHFKLKRIYNKYIKQNKININQIIKEIK